MLSKELYRTYVQILKDELVPAMGCTEPIAIAYAGAVARKTLGPLPERVEVAVSRNIIKNVKSVVVPHTGGLRGIEAAAAAGIVAGDAAKELEVISHVEQEDIEAIFDRYRVLDYFERKSERGLSFQGDLRLAICHSIVVRMQGEIKVESTPNAQTTFTVLLPQLKVTAENAPTADNIVPASKEYGLPLPTVTRREFPFDKNRRTVFIVNDNSEIMNFVAELFAADYNIKMPSGKTEMIELLKQMHPDIVICDALSEQSDCLSLIQFIKQGKLTSHIPVILLSTAQQIDERIKGVESGADICLTLPFNVEYLKAVAEQLLRRNRSLKDYYKSSISAFELSDGRMLHQDDKEFIDRMLKIINDNISNTEISTKFIADELGVSIRNLYRRLEGILNQTPTNIIKEYRLAKAEQLLTTTKLSIDEIIYKAGFVNRGTFFKCFSAKYGCTPKVYRKEKLSQIRQEVGEESEDAADRSA